MRSMLTILGIVVAAIGIGTALHYFGPASLRKMPSEQVEASVPVDVATAVPYTVIAEGDSAVGVSVRKNIAVYTEEEYVRLWKLAYGDTKPAPVVDFSTQYVIGVFAGEKSSGGYAISVKSVTDEGGTRTVGIELSKPAAGCMVSQALTRPFQIVSVPFTPFPLARTDSEREVPCS